MNILGWPFKLENMAAVSGFGFWLNIISFILTIAGLAFAIYQILQTRSELTIIQEETKRIKSSLITYDALQESSKAQYALRAAMKHFRNSNWADGAESYEDFRRYINQIDNNSNLDTELTDQIASASEYIINICERIDKISAKNTGTINFPKTHTVMKSHDQLIARILQTLNRRAFDAITNR